MSLVLFQDETVLPSRLERFVCQPSASAIPINILYRNPFSTELFGSKSTTSRRETTVSDPEMFSVADIWQVRILSMIVSTLSIVIVVEAFVYCVGTSWMFSTCTMSRMLENFSLDHCF